MNYWYTQHAAILKKYKDWGQLLVDTMIKERDANVERGKSMIFTGHNHLYDNYEQTLSHLLPVSCLPMSSSDKKVLVQEDLIRLRSQIWCSAYNMVNLRLHVLPFFFLFFDKKDGVCVFYFIL